MYIHIPSKEYSKKTEKGRLMTKEQLDWRELDMLCTRFCLTTFAESMNHLSGYLLGDVSYSQLSSLDKRVLDDTFKEVSLPSSKTWQRICKAMEVLRSGWKFRHFNDVSMIKELSHSFFAYLLEKDGELRQISNYSVTRKHLIYV